MSNSPSQRNDVSPTSTHVEKMLNNIDHKFISEAPFLIED
jgi:hypothetical protein